MHPKRGHRAPAALRGREEIGAEVLVLPHGGRQQALVLPAREVVRTVTETERD